MAVVYVDGEWFDKDSAKISVYDHGLLYGDGLFEGIRVYSGNVFKLNEHIDRLFEGACAILLEVPMERLHLELMLTEGVRRFTNQTGLTDGYIRLVVTRGSGDLGIDPAKCSRATVIAIFDTIELYAPEYYEKGISVVTAATRRLESTIFDPRVKSLNYLNNILAKLEAKQAGCIEAVMLNRDGYVTECTADNIFLVTGGVLKTPAPHLGLLKGITRQTVINLAMDSMKTSSNIAIESFEEAVLTRFDLYTADECFLTGSGAELMPVVSIDGRRIGSGRPGPVTQHLTAAFQRFAASPASSAAAAVIS